MSPDVRHGAAIGAAAAARISFAKTSCAAGGLELLPEEDPSMTIPPELKAQILRYYHVEKWTMGTIAAQLRVHYGAVARVLAQAGLPRIGRPPRPSRIDRLFRHRRIRADASARLAAGPGCPPHGMVPGGPRPSGPNTGRMPGVTQKTCESGAIAAVPAISVT